MPLVTITVGNKAFRLECGAGDEPRVKVLASDLEARLARLSAATGSPVNERLLVMAALMILDELAEAKAALPSKLGGGAGRAA